LFTTVEGTLPPREWLVELFTAGALSALDRAALLIGRMPGRAADASPMVCACRGVRAERIAAAIADGAADLDAVAEITGAGSNCGSCRPEITRLIAQSRARHAA
jgi:assimilatory nitrate reductase catalytic subunit